MKVLVVGGLSGGHIFPALGFLDSLKLKYKDVQTLLVLPKAVFSLRVKIEAEQVSYVSICNLKLNFSRESALTVFNFFRGSFESLSLLIKFKPDVVVGFGSIISVPLIVFAWLFRIKTVIHEQNVLPGRANAFLARFSDKIAVSFQDTIRYFPASCPGKVVFTGNPLRRSLVPVDKKEAADYFGFDHRKFTVLVMGGSCGSHNINTVFLEAVSRFNEKNALQVIHLSGAKDYDFLKQGYDKVGVSAKLYDFFCPMQYAYSAASLAICRSGALTVAEITAFSLAAILVPYPYAAGHQAANAALLQKKKAALVIPDKELSWQSLLKNIEEMLKFPERIDQMRLAYRDILVTNAGGRLADEIKFC